MSDVAPQPTIDLSFLEDRNWDNLPGPLPYRVTVRFGNGAIHHTYSRQALKRWLTEDQAVIIATGESV